MSETATEVDPRITLKAKEVRDLRIIRECPTCKGAKEIDAILPSKSGEKEQCYDCRGAGTKTDPFPLLINGIQWPDQSKMLDAFSFMGHEIGAYVAVRPCKENKTFLGIYLGEFASGISASLNEKHELVLQYGHGNPAIYVPDLKRIVRGYESWWGEIKDEKHLREITDADINGAWYVQAMKQIMATDKSPNPQEQP